MKIFGFSIWRKNTKKLISEINELLPAEIGREQYLLGRLQTLVIFLESDRQKEVDGILNSGKELFTGEDLPAELQLKFKVISTWPLYLDFLEFKKSGEFDKKLGKFLEDLTLFKDNPDLQLKDTDIETIKINIQNDFSKAAFLQAYFAQLDYNLKSISVPLKVLMKRGIRLRKLYVELREQIESKEGDKYLRRFKKEDVLAFTTTVYRKLQEFSYLVQLIDLVDTQRVLTRKARYMYFKYKNYEALACIEDIKKLVIQIFLEENKRLLGIMSSEAPWDSIPEGNDKLALLQSLELMQIDNLKLVLRKKGWNSCLRTFRNIIIMSPLLYSVYGTSVSFALSSMPPPGPASSVDQAKAKSILPIYTYTQNPINAKVPKQDIQIKTEFGNLKGWFFKSNDSDKIVIVTHAIFHNKSWEAPLIELLTGKGYNVIAFDFPGHGENDWKIGSVSYGINESKIVLEVLKKAEDLGYKEAVLVGQSMGAASSVKAAANYNGVLKIKGIAAGAMYASLMDSFYKVGQEKFGIWKWLTHFGTWLGGLVTGVNYSSFDSMPDIKKLNKKGVPILYHYGEKDDKLSPNVVKPIKELAKPPDTIKVYEGRGHTAYWGDERAERDEDVGNFISSHMNPA